MTTNAQESGERSRPTPSDTDPARLLAFLNGAGNERRGGCPASDGRVYYLVEGISCFAEPARMAMQAMTVCRSISGPWRRRRGHSKVVGA